MRRFAADAAHAEDAAGRFPLVAEALVRQTARLLPTPWQDALAALVDRAAGVDWWLAGSGLVS